MGLDCVCSKQLNEVKFDRREIKAFGKDIMYWFVVYGKFHASVFQSPRILEPEKVQDQLVAQSEPH